MQEKIYLVILLFIFIKRNKEKTTRLYWYCTFNREFNRKYGIIQCEES